MPTSPRAGAVRWAEAVARALAFLGSTRLPYGEFPAYRHAQPDLSDPGDFDSSPFVTSLVAYSLAWLPHPSAGAMVQGAIEFLVSEREPDGTLRYWSSRNGRRIDPDVDDTCCAALVIRASAPEQHVEIAERVLENRSAAGLLKTWFRADEAPNDVDAVVNANALAYLGERADAIPVARILSMAVRRGVDRGSSPYYTSPMALCHALSKAYFHGSSALADAVPVLVGRLREQQAEDGSFGDALATALAACALLNLGLGCDPMTARACDALCEAQATSGALPRCAFYAGPEPPAPRSVWWGSEALTTALAAEALWRARAAAETHVSS